MQNSLIKGNIGKKIQINILFFITILLYLISIGIYEFVVCRNFSIFIIVMYIVFLALYIIFNKKFIEPAIEIFEGKTKKIIIGLYILVAVIIGIYVCLKWISIYKIALTIITLIMGLICIIYLSKDYVKNVLVTLFTVGIIFSTTTDFFHPLDEKRHFMTALNISVGNLDYENNPKIDETYNKIEFFTNLDNFVPLFQQKYEANFIDGKEGLDINSLPTDYNPIIYIPAAVGIYIARLLGGSVADIFIAGRIFNLIAYAIMLTIIFKLLPFKRKIFYVVYMLPMMIMLCGSYSADVACIGLVGIFIAYCLNLYAKKVEEIKIKQILIGMALFALSLLAKDFAYIGVGFLVFMLPVWKIIKNNKKQMPIVLVIVAMAVVLFGIKLSGGEQIAANDPRGGETSMQSQIEFLKSNPTNILKVGFNHIMNSLLNFDWYTHLNQNVFFNQYYKNIFILQFIFILYVAITDYSKKFNLKEKIVPIITFLLVFGSTSLILYLTFTAVGNTQVSGYQTRYIVPILPLILMLLNNRQEKEKEENKLDLIPIINTLFIIIDLICLIRE